MRYLRTRWLVMGIFALTAALVSPATASANFMLRLSDGTTSFTLTDGGPGDINPTAGAITFSGGIGNFIVNVTTGLSKPVLGNASQPHMDLNSVHVTTATGGTLTIDLWDNNFSPTGPGALSTLIGGTITGGAGSSLSASAYKNSNNVTPFSNTGDIAQVNLGPFGNGAFSASSFALHGAIANPYSMSLHTVLNLSPGVNGSGSASYDFDVQNIVPAPPGVVLALSGLPIAFGAWLRRRKATAVAA